MKPSSDLSLPGAFPLLSYDKPFGPRMNANKTPAHLSHLVIAQELGREIHPQARTIRNLPMCETGFPAVYKYIFVQAGVSGPFFHDHEIRYRRRDVDAGRGADGAVGIMGRDSDVVGVGHRSDLLHCRD